MLGKLSRFFVKEKPRISRQESMKGVPVFVPGVESEEGPDGERLLFVPRKTAFAGIIKAFGGPTEVSPGRVLLDELGNRVWKMIDGRRNVGQIVKRFAAETGLHRREAEASVVAFLNSLMKRGVVSIVLK